MAFVTDGMEMVCGWLTTVVISGGGWGVVVRGDALLEGFVG